MANTISKNLLTFIKNSPSPFHSIASIKKILKREGFIELNENLNYDLATNNKYYVVRNDSSIIAFKTPENFDHYSFNIVASHSDCPSYKIKPIAELTSDGYKKLNVEGYGGMLPATWFDRPLSIAGRVIIGNEKKISSKLINFDKNILSLPSVAIHFNRNADDKITASDMFPTLSQNEHTLKELLAKELNGNIEEIISYDLFVYNHQEGYFWGADEEFISSPKLDDLQCAYTTLMGFIKSENIKNVAVFCCFDNEEVGSTTRQGANSNFLNDTLLKISSSLNMNHTQHLNALANSFMISADNAHAVHPNHPELTDPQNKVYMNKGIVIKYNASQSYTSDAITGAVFTMICKKVNVPYQIFTNKSGSRGGGTLGNISATHVSIPTVDIGIAQLAMHSCCETSGTVDNEYMSKVIKEYYENYLLIDKDGNISINK